MLPRYDDGRRAGGEDDRIIKAEARRMANATGDKGHVVGAPGGRRQGPGRVRRSASARMRARERAGLVVDGGATADEQSLGVGRGTMIHCRRFKKQ
jgi:hypothetical protein